MEKQYDVTMRELKQQHDELVLKMALLQDEYQTDKNIEAALRGNPEYEAALQQYKERTEPKILAAINAIPLQQRENRVKHFSFRALNVAAAILAITFLMTASALAWIPAVRYTALQFLVSIESTHTRLRLVEDPDAVHKVPIQWRGEYFPIYIPEGFSVHNVVESELSPEVEYRNENGEQLILSEHNIAASATVDSENAIIEDITIKGESGQCVMNGNTVNIYWKHDNKYFILLYNGARSEAMVIAESLEKIAK